MLTPKCCRSFVALFVLISCWTLIQSERAFADFIIYSPPGTKSAIVLEGRTKVVSAGLIEYVHPGYSAIVLDRENAQVVKSPTRLDEYRKLWNRATKANKVEDYLSTAQFALQNGRINEFFDCCSAAYKLDPKNPTIVDLVKARKKVKQPISGFESVEANIREITKLKDMKVARSAHYVMLHDLKEGANAKNSRVNKRLQLLELVYESFFLKFAFQGTVLEPPKEPMMVLLFSDERDYLRYATQLDPKLQSASGFWSPKDNISVFYDQGTTLEMKVLTKIMEELQQLKVQARGTAISREVAQMTNSLDLIVKIAKDESDVEVVSHEATHQLAGNTGLMPREKLGLSWAHEGLASYFETPAGAGWGGVGAVNPTRLRGYRRIARDPGRNQIELLISDILFDASGDQQGVVDAYGSAWALTHYLMDQQPLKLVEYYRKCAELTEKAEGGKLSRQEIVDTFEEVFGDIPTLERSFHAYMSNQQSVLERMLDAAIK